MAPFRTHTTFHRSSQKLRRGSMILKGRRSQQFEGATCEYVYVHMHAYVHLYLYICVYLYLYLYINRCVRICLHVYIRKCGRADWEMCGVLLFKAQLAFELLHRKCYLMGSFTVCPAAQSGEEGLRAVASKIPERACVEQTSFQRGAHGGTTWC